MKGKLFLEKSRKASSDTVFVSIYQKDGLFFAVGVYPASRKIVRIFLPTSCRETLYEQISHEFADFELTEKYLPLVKDISKIYNGQKANINQDILELSVNKTEPLKGPVPNEFDLKVLQSVLKIPKGEVKTYKEVAESLDSKAWRAVGSAMARNPFPLLIPCHRVVKSDLTLGNYGGGVEMKKKLLKNEGVMIKGFRVMKK